MLSDISFLSSIIQLGLFLAAFWLALETRALRRVSAMGFAHSQEAEVHKIAPEISMFAVLDKNFDFTATRGQNVSANLVVNCIGFIYDRNNHNYMVSIRARNFFKPGSHITSALSKQRHDLDGVIKQIQVLLSGLDYNDLRQQIANAIACEPEKHVIGYVFHDTLRNPYMRLRFTEIIGGRLKYRASPYSGRPVPLKRMSKNSSLSPKRKRQHSTS